MWVIVALAGALAGAAPTPSAARIDQARDAVLDDGYQAALPGHAGDGAHLSGPRHGRFLVAPAGGDDERDDASLDAGPLGTIVGYLLWVAAIVGAAIIGLWMARELSRYAGDAELDDGGERAPPPLADIGILDRPLGDADELARQGRFADAIHTLLLRTLQELARSAQVRVGPADTSREILGRVPLLADARTAFAGLITAVEITYFGGGVPDADDYGRCRDQFHRFAAAFRAPAAAA